jgi:DNA-binding SARP family transcriptional activator
MYEIQLFGRLQVRTRGVRLAGRDFGGVRPRHLLALLALHGALGSDELTELLWDGRPPADHVATVQGYVAVLRHRLDPNGESVVATGNGGYVLIAERVRVDVARFDELVAAAIGRTPARALPPLRAAAHLANQPLLTGERSAWVDTARTVYRARLVETLLDAAGCALSAELPREALALADRAVDLDPAAERGWRIAIAAQRTLDERVADRRAVELVAP